MKLNAWSLVTGLLLGGANAAEGSQVDAEVRRVAVIGKLISKIEKIGTMDEDRLTDKVPVPPGRLPPITYGSSRRQTAWLSM